MNEHPIQPLELDQHNILRFKRNEIVRFLLDKGPFDMNELARRQKRFSREDREQFAQLIGYSWSGACDLSYMSTDTLNAARKMHDSGERNAELARIKELRGQLDEVREKLRDGVAALYGCHPHDLGGI